VGSLPQLTASKSLFRYQSGRVIALGRVMLVTCFLIALMLDRGEAAQDAKGTFGLLVSYEVLAIVIAVATWRNWWLDARLAVATHALDMAVFTAIVFSANGTTSPFFLFFVLPLLSAAIRWNWRETALTATALVALHLIAGFLVAGSQSFEIERFVVRSGHLVILSLLLIWFGVHQRFTRLQFAIDDAGAAGGEGQDPLIQALTLARSSTLAAAGALVIGPLGEDSYDGIAVVHGERRVLSGCRSFARDLGETAMLFDVRRDRALTRPEGRFEFKAASALLDVDELRRLGAGKGLLVEVRTETQQGWLVLWEVRDLSTDFIDFGRELGRAIGGILDRYALLTAIESGAAARTRLSLARDVHDSVVQFLAGASFRVEAIKRSAKGDARLGAELDELKRLLIEEQGEVRGFVLSLRKGRELELAEAAAELRALAERLSQQWSVKCRVQVDGEDAAIPVRLQLDLQQLLREAVANAVRHGGADRIDVALAVEHGQLSFNVHDNGSGFPEACGVPRLEPRSLKERVERANGSLHLESEPGSTDLHFSIPLGAAA
jgi:signal transduction histidine kinase